MNKPETVTEAKTITLLRAAAAHLAHQRAQAGAIPMPDTEPQRYIAIGTPAEIAVLLREDDEPASTASHPARRLRRGDRPTEPLEWDDAATSGDAPTDEPVAYMYQDDADKADPGTGSCVITRVRQACYRNETPLYARIERAAAPAPTYEQDLLDIVRSFCCTAKRLAELTPQQREHYPSPLSPMSPLFQAASAACVERGYDEWGIAIEGVEYPVAAAPAPTAYLTADRRMLVFADTLAKNGQSAAGMIPLFEGAAPATASGDELPTSQITDGESARVFVAEWHRKNFPTDRTFTNYIMGRSRHCALAGDFAWQLAKALEAMEARAAVSAATKPVPLDLTDLPPPLCRDDTEHDVEYYRADDVRSLLATKPAAAPEGWRKRLQDELAAQEQHYSEASIAAAAGSRLHVAERNITEGVIKGVEYCIAALEELEAAAPAAPTAAPAEQVRDEWISVDEKLPPKGVEVLVYLPNGGDPIIAMDTWDELYEAPVSFSSTAICGGEGWGSLEFEDVTHWMPLPAAPVSAPDGAQGEGK